jgi:hypothetical protein
VELRVGSFEVLLDSCVLIFFETFSILRCFVAVVGVCYSLGFLFCTVVWGVKCGIFS